jgi:hypothetical protein
MNNQLSVLENISNCKELTDTAKTTILICLTFFADDYGRGPWPTIQELAHLAREKERTVKRVLWALERDGWLTFIRSIEYGVNWKFAINLARLYR